MTKRYTIAFSDGEADDIRKYIDEKKRFRSVSDFVRFLVRKSLEEQRERKAVAIRGITMSLGNEALSADLDEETIKAIREKLGLE